jgi:hypothetical protein
MKDHVYSHRFQDGTVATLTVTADPLAFRVQWSKRLSPRLLNEYFEWRQVALNDFTARTGKRLLVLTPA